MPVALGKPEWWPLEQFVIREWKASTTELTPFHVAKFCSQFMFMGESDCTGQTYSLYKHSLSRRYLILHKASIDPHHYRKDAYVRITAHEAISFIDEYLEANEQVWNRTLS